MKELDSQEEKKTYKNGWLINHRIAVNEIIPHLLVLEIILDEKNHRHKPNRNVWKCQSQSQHTNTLIQSINSNFPCLFIDYNFFFFALSWSLF